MKYLVLTENAKAINWKEQGFLLKEEANYIWDIQKRENLRNIWFTVKSRNAVLMIEEENEKMLERYLINYLW